MTIRHLISIAFLFCFVVGFAQEKAIDTVFIFDNHLRNSKTFQKTATLKAVELVRNTTNLSEVLRFQSPVYIKENGRGMVSSPSFRGTTAQQTAFVWNGINVNSLFLGQGDINNMNVLGYDELNIKSGGGSVIYGSGAIGGSIHLNNDLNFNQDFKTALFLEAGSFGTFNSLLKTSYSNEYFSLKVSANVIESKNDYEVPEKNYRNLNGAYDNRTFNIGAAYRLSAAHNLSWQTQFYDGAQHYPTSEFGTPTKYLSNSLRTLLNWKWSENKFNNAFAIAYLEDEFQYFDQIDQPKSSGGAAKSYLAKNDFNFIFNDKFAFDFIAEYRFDRGEGFSSGIKTAERNVGSVAGLFRWNPTLQLKLEGGMKKDFVQDLETPFLYSFSGQMKISESYSAVLNMSKNFRYPSFNDMYWQPGGNIDLSPEISHQVEIGNNVGGKNWKINITPYFIQIKNMIQWLPTADGYWSPVNTHRVESYGIESQIDITKNWGNNMVKLTTGYVLTHSKNKETKQFLMYVPKHKIFGTASYIYSFFEIFAQGTFNGLTYTTSDEKRSEAIDPYFVLNGGIHATLFKNYKFGLKVNNVLNQIYQTTAFYPLPKRNLSANLLINF